MNDSNHSLISSTAKLVAHFRQFTDIPYTKTVVDHFDIEEFIETKFQTNQTELNQIKWMAVYLEARYKSLVNQIEINCFEQILEFASGISLRGLALSKQKDVVYVDSDLEDISRESKKLVEQIDRKSQAPTIGRHFVQPANILSTEDVKSLCSFF